MTCDCQINENIKIYSILYIKLRIIINSILIINKGKYFKCKLLKKMLKEPSRNVQDTEIGHKKILRKELYMLNIQPNIHNLMLMG